MTIEEAFLIREKIRAIKRGDPLKGILEQILYGVYDKYSNGVEIANDDLIYITTQRNGSDL